MCVCMCGGGGGGGGGGRVLVCCNYTNINVCDNGYAPKNREYVCFLSKMYL